VNSDPESSNNLYLKQYAIDHVVDGIYWSDAQARILDVNDGACKMVGYSREELTSMTVAQLDPKFPIEKWPVHWDILKRQGSSTFETVHRHKDGHAIAVEITSNFIDYNGRELHCAFVRDITERKRAEEELRINAIAFESHESMMITDADGVILRINQAFTESTGYTAEEAVGQTPRLLKSGRHNADFYRAMWETIQRTGAWQGEIWNRRKNGEVYPEWLTISAVKAGNGVVTHYVGSYLDMTEHKAAEESIKNLAFYDPLTSLPNRRLLLDRLHQASASSARSGREGALLFIDLDNFKDINDTLGHDIGDLLLQQTAQRLESCLRESDTVARLGGDEFVVMLEDLSEHALEAAAQTKTVGEKILATLSQPYQLATHKYHSTPSIGATIFSDHGQSGEELLKRADIAMYQAKKAGRNTLRFFDPQMQVSITARVSLESELRKALENQQFQLHYQIQVDSSHRPLGAEALIRWIHPLRGMVSPAQFIPLAEETGLILPIGLWVLETACAQLKAWQQEALTRDLVLAVNVSAKQFHQANFVAQVQAAVQYHAINPMLLKLELTEGMLLENIEDTIATMNALKEIGVQFSLDDFGTGYSSLQYLKRLPLDQLKIDQSFVRDIAIDNSDKAIVHTIIAMAQSLNLNVIAEGVETEEQRQLLMERGCTHYQGYLFSKPVPIEQFEALLKQG
jgi:diguanylate cyclase (GGDEF)-like protein/PAS domain S-box-containing protein